MDKSNKRFNEIGKCGGDCLWQRIEADIKWLLFYSFFSIVNVYWLNKRKCYMLAVGGFEH